jgi:succinate dehydrogenase / fumarate reductase cytochrome b subunit
MAFGKNVGLQGLRYRGGGPMWAWLLHRITALGIVLFVGTHIIVSFSSQQLQSHLADRINDVYKSTTFQLVVYFCVIFHTLNGMRIIILDFFPKYLKYQREVIWLEWLLFLPIYGLAVYFFILRLT